MLRSPNRVADAILVVACVLQLLTIREGQSWGDDFAQYITHARNLVERRPYDDIGLLRAGQRLGPPEYPPIFPAMLAPVYFVFGPSPPALKIVGIVSLLLALLLFRRLVATTLGGGSLVAWALLVGFHPYLYAFTSMVLSEPAFMLWTAAALLALHRWGEMTPPPRRGVPRHRHRGARRAIGRHADDRHRVAARGRADRVALQERLAPSGDGSRDGRAVDRRDDRPGAGFGYGVRLADVHPIRHVQLYWADLTSFLPGFDEPSALGALNSFRQIADSPRSETRCRLQASRSRPSPSHSASSPPADSSWPFAEASVPSTSSFSRTSRS